MIDQLLMSGTDYLIWRKKGNTEQGSNIRNIARNQTTNSLKETYIRTTRYLQ